MSLYSDFIVSGALVTQHSFQNVSQNEVITVSHDSDSARKRMIQVLEFKAESSTSTDTALDFDLSDEGDFLQEDTVSGTDFVDGKVLLHRIFGEDVFGGQQKIYASDTEVGDWFGNSVSIYGDTAIVGAVGEDTGGSNTGAAYIFTRSGSTWTQQQKLKASDAQIDDEFGYSVSIYGDTAIVGARWDEAGGSNAGAAYIFTRSGSTWTQQQKIQASDAQADDWFGNSVSIYGDTAIVCAVGEDTGGSNAGAAYIFTRSGSTWTQQQKIQAYDEEANDQFGNSVSIYGDTAIVGAVHENAGGSDAGAAYIFTRSDTVWTQQQKIQASDTQAASQFGYSVSIYGDTAIVGSKDEDTGGNDVGAAYIFTRSGSTWTQQQKIQASDAQAADQFGYSVSIYGDTAIVGAWWEDAGGSNAGAAYIFTRTGSTWTQQQKMVAQGAEASDQYGYSVAIYDGTVIIGANLEDEKGADAGAAFISTSKPFTTFKENIPYYITTTNTNHVSLADISKILSCTITSSIPTDTSIKCLASFDGRSTWEKWGGSSWETHVGGLDNLQTGNDIAEFQTGFNNLVLASGIGYVDFAFDLLTTNTLLSPEIDAVTISYEESGYYTHRSVSYDYDIDLYSL